MTMQHERHAIVASRRAVLAGLLVGSCAPLGAPRAQGFFAQARIPIGLQLFPLAKEARRDLAGTLRQVASIGYETIQLPNYLGYTPAELRQALDRTGLRCPSVHIMAQPIVKGRSLADGADQLAKDAAILGFDTVVTPIFYVSDAIRLTLRGGETAIDMLRRVAAGMTRDDWMRNAEFLNRRGAQLRRVGLRLAYHNHNNELRPLGEESDGLQLLIEQTDPAAVDFELDLGWVAAAGRDPVSLLAKYKGRFRSVHLKDVARGSRPDFALHHIPAELGEGALDWEKLLRACRATGVRDYFVEREEPFALPPLETLARSLAYLRQVGRR